MLLLKRISAFTSALVLSVASLLVISVPKAAAAEITWSGAGENSLFSNTANWVGGVVPQNGDSVVFPADVENRQAELDIEDLSLIGITFSGESASCISEGLSYGFVLFGSETLMLQGILTQEVTGDCSGVRIEAGVELNDDLHLELGGNLRINSSLNLGTHQLTSSSNTGQQLYIDGTLAGDASSGITLEGSTRFHPVGDGASFLGNVQLDDTSTISIQYNTLALGPGSAGSITVNDNAYLSVYMQHNDEFPKALNLNAATDSSLGNVNIYVYSESGAAQATFSGDIQLTANQVFSTSGSSSSSPRTVSLTGAINGAHAITPLAGTNGTLIIDADPNNSETPNGTYASPLLEREIDEDQGFGEWITGNTKVTIISGVTVTGSTEVRDNATLVVNGAHDGTVTMNDESVLMGTGEITGIVTMNDGTTIAPGLSPGCLSTGNLVLEAGSTYEFEIAGNEVCDEYDQIDVTGTVTIDDAILDVSFLDNFVPAAGDEFIIIQNDGSDAVDGTFDGLAEGAEFTVGGVTFSISYEGGSGNDVVLTVTAVDASAVPGAPDTGFGLLLANPFVALISTLMIASAMLLLAKKEQLLSK